MSPALEVRDGGGSGESGPETLAGMLGAPVYPASEVAGRTGRPGVAVGLCWTPSGGGEVLFVEVTTMAGSRALTLTGS